MASIFVSADFNLTVELPEPNFMDEWDSEDAKEICDEYGHPLCTIDFRIENPDEPISPMLIFVPDNGAYEGEMHSEKLAPSVYRFLGSGKFKVNVHKDTLNAIKSGAVPKLFAVTRYRQSYDLSNDKLLEGAQLQWTFSAKKL